MTSTTPLATVPGNYRTPPQQRAIPPKVKRKSTPPMWWKDVAGVLVWASLLVVTALWTAAGGVHALNDGMGSAMQSLGRLAALWSSDLLMLQILLMARVPFIERSYGQDELIRIHRLVGFSSFNLLMLHLLLTVMGLAEDSDTNALKELWVIVSSYPEMIKATIGTLMIVLVVVTSIKMARASMKYENWHVIHLYAYLGVFFAMPHQLEANTFDGTLASLSWGPAYWWTLFAITMGSVLIWRIALPLRLSMKHKLRVTEVIHENHNVTTVIMQGRHLEKLHAEGGQFFIWRFLTGNKWLQGHGYSLSEAPRGDRLRVTIKSLGDASSEMPFIPLGTRVLIEGPYGRLTKHVRTRRKVTLIASGIGITVMRALMEELNYAPGDLTLIYRASTDADFVLKSELDTLAAARGAKVYYIPGGRNRMRPSWLPESAHQWDDAQALHRLAPDIAFSDVYLCGTEDWMTSTQTALKKAGVPEEHIHSERFNW